MALQENEARFKLALWDIVANRPSVWWIGIRVSDIGMPEMDGYGLMRQVRGLLPEQGGRISAIALTAYAGEVDRQQAPAAGFQMHIAKPVEPEKLVKALVDLAEQGNSTDLPNH
jgi:CheY-like chemotaxis protein